MLKTKHIDQEMQSELNDAPNTASPESIHELQQPQKTPIDLAVPTPPLSNSQQSQQTQNNSTRVITEEEQVLASKLQETYRCIVKLEAECQRGCIELNNRLFQNETSEISTELWSVYRNIITLLDFYYDFLLYALRPSSARAGKQIVSIYKIPRRMWVYGIVGFLEVLKNVVTVFIEHEICSSFISYAFNIISCLTDSSLDMEGWWAEKLGDLSRMAIALYPSRYIDWKRSSEYWYQVSMKTQYGHGKIYYHMSTVQQDNLDALVNIGKSVTCRDAFVPTPQYLRMVVDNICNQRNILSSIELTVIDFIKIHKIMLLPAYNENVEMLNIVSNYSKSLGVSENGVSFFEQRDNVSSESLQFWFQKGGNFALCNINHLIGFGESKNPFAKLFNLPEALKERRERKDRKRKSKGSDMASDDANSSQDDLLSASELSEDDWFELLPYVNKGVVELSMRMLRDYTRGPKAASYSQVLVWLYFIVALGESVKTYPESKKMIEYWVKKFFPWVSLIKYFNDILYESRHKEVLRDFYKAYFNENTDKRLIPLVENIPEAWKCWGSLWFDTISKKFDYNNTQEAAVSNSIFDVPLGGPFTDSKHEKSRIVRITLLAKYIADEFNFGLCINEGNFKFRYQNDPLSQPEYEKSFLADYMNDPRFSQLSDLFEQGLVTQFVDPKINDEEFIYPLKSIWPNKSLYSSYFFDKKLRDRMNDDQGDEDEDVASVESFADDEDENFDVDILDHDHGAHFNVSNHYLSLDTNIFLKHIGIIFKAITGKAIKVAIPLVVFQELRSLRRSQDPGVSDAATRAVIAIRQLFNDYNSTNLIIALKFDGSLTPSLSDTSDFETHSNWRINADDLIVRSVKGLDNNSPTGGVYMVTDDKNLKLRSQSMGVMSHSSKWFTDIIKNYN